MNCVVCFFFQAEDGIRDRNVTGVQTCALPISYWGRFEVVSALLGHFSEKERREVIREKDRWEWTVLHRAARSEERRVGKECRSRRWRGSWEGKVRRWRQGRTWDGVSQQSVMGT